MSTELATIDAPAELRESVNACVRWSQNNAIVCADDYATTAGHLQQIKSRQKAADEFFDGPIAQAHQLHKMLVARKKLITDPLATSERLDKQKMLAYQQAEAEKAAAEQRRLQAIADEQARIEREKAEANAEAARQLAAEADSGERQRLLEEADAEEEKAAQVVAPVIHVAAEVPKVAGIITKKIWTYQITNTALVPREFLMVDEAKLKAYARAMKDGASVPGVRFFPEDSMSSRGAA